MRKNRNKRSDTRPEWKIQQEQAGYIEVPASKKELKPLQAKTKNQEQYINAIDNYKVVFGVGPAGTGKTYIAAVMAANMLMAGAIDKIIITRPAVEAGEELGFLPGEIEDKYAPYLTPLISVLEKRLGKSQVEYFLKSKKIEAVPLAYMRGMTFENAFIILDEAQNVTPTQMKMFLTRIGEDCKVVVDGDAEQKDIPGLSGLEDAIKRVSFIPSIAVVNFNDRDVVRSGLAAEIVQAYRN